MNKCSICLSPNRPGIDDLLDAGTNQKTVAAQFGVSRYALSRHVRHSKPAPANAPDSGNGESLEVQAEKWLSRADDIYATSTANGDVRGQVQSLTAAFRGLELQAKAESRAAESVSVTGSDAPVTIEYMDSIIRKALDTPRGRALDKLRVAPDKLIELV
jgi:hypothetical protein